MNNKKILRDLEELKVLELDIKFGIEYEYDREKCIGILAINIEKRDRRDHKNFMSVIMEIPNVYPFLPPNIFVVDEEKDVYDSIDLKKEWSVANGIRDILLMIVEKYGI